MRLLLANPNTTQSVTDTIAAAARAAAAAGTEIVPATARFGGRVIGTRTEMAIAEHAALDLLAREMLAIPVLGLTESALHVACLTGGRFGTITISRRSAWPLREMVAA